MKTTSYILICLIGLAYECRAYGPQPQQPVHFYGTQHFPHPFYGTPQSTKLGSGVKYNTPTYNPSHQHIGQNYEVQLSQPSKEHHHQFVNVGRTYLPPSSQSQAVAQQSFQQTLPGSPLGIPYTQQQQSLSQTPHQSQSTLSTSFTPSYQPDVVAKHFAGQNNQVAAHDNSVNTKLQQSVSTVNGAVSNYISQSEASQLDHYFEKQNPVGEVRAYSRVISTCYKDGHCDQQKLGSGQVDAKHQIIVLSARASVQPLAKKCGTANSAGFPINHNSVTEQGVKQISADSATKPIRPPNRRLYPYTETIIARDPFN